LQLELHLLGVLPQLSLVLGFCLSWFLEKEERKGRGESVIVREMPIEYAGEEPKGNRGKRLTILSIDGGGVRGLIPATILEDLEGKLQVKPHCEALRGKGEDL
jgi:hypothetical protein